MREEFYKRLGRPVGDLGLKRREQDVLYDKKWKIFLRRTRLFRHLPFVDFVFAAGSMALGNINKNSDFDVIVGVREGRIYTARFFSVLAFGALRARRKKLTHHEHAKDKICLNHFVTAKSACLSPPHNIYWQELYQNIVPLYGKKERIEFFFKANNWAGEPKTNLTDLRYQHRYSLIKTTGTYILSGKLGDIIEKKLKNFQIKRIHSGFLESQGFAPRIRVTDDELEFHPDTRRISELIGF